MTRYTSDDGLCSSSDLANVELWNRIGHQHAAVHDDDPVELEAVTGRASERDEALAQMPTGVPVDDHDVDCRQRPAHDALGLPVVGSSDITWPYAGAGVRGSEPASLDVHHRRPGRKGPFPWGSADDALAARATIAIGGSQRSAQTVSDSRSAGTLRTRSLSAAWAAK